MQIEEKPPFDTPFEWIGGEPRVKLLVDRFYDLMDLEPGYKALRAAHGPDLASAREKLNWFLCGWMGGPQHYVERFGHPRLRARHMPFSIGILERDQWLACMDQAMDDVGVDATLRAAQQIGREEPLRLLLNQRDPARAGRMFAYYSYFGRARAGQIAGITHLISSSVPQLPSSNVTVIDQSGALLSQLKSKPFFLFFLQINNKNGKEKRNRRRRIISN